MNCEVCDKPDLLLEYSGLCRKCYRKKILSLVRNAGERKTIQALFDINERALKNARDDLIEGIQGFCQETSEQDKQDIINKIKEAL